MERFYLHINISNRSEFYFDVSFNIGFSKWPQPHWWSNPSFPTAFRCHLYCTQHFCKYLDLFQNILFYSDNLPNSSAASTTQFLLLYLYFFILISIRAGEEGGLNRLVIGLLGQWEYSVWYCNDGDLSSYVYPNATNAQHREWTLK